MPTIKIELKSQHSPLETFNKVKDLIEKDPGLRKLDAHYECTFNEQSLTGKAKGKQFTADMQVIADGDSASKVSLGVELPFLLGIIKGQVQSTLTKKLEALLS